MAISVKKNYTDTAISGAVDVSKVLAKINFESDFVRGDVNSSEATIHNLTSPISFPESIRFGISRPVNVYKGTGIDPSFYPPSRQGVQFLTRLEEVWTVEDSDDPSYKIALPVSAHTVVRVPNSEHISASDVQTLLIRLLSTAYGQNSGSTDRIAGLLRGSLLPQEVR